MENQKVLMDLGLSDYEYSAHDATRYKERIADTQNLSRKSAIPIGNIYVGLSDLSDMGVVTNG